MSKSTEGVNEKWGEKKQREKRDEMEGRKALFTSSSYTPGQSQLMTHGLRGTT